MDEKEYLVKWEINVSATNPRDAAKKVWTEIFGRSPEPSVDESCFFNVIDGDGTEEVVDLAIEEIES